MDIVKAMELNESSWTTHYIAAQIHQFKNDLQKAIYHFQRALSISSNQPKVRNDLYSCKVLAGIQNRNDHLNPHQMPMNLQERVAHLENETGIKVSENDFDKYKLSSGICIPGEDHVYLGHKHFAGWNIPQDFNEAFKHYEKAAQARNPEGMYNLAMCYQFGHGVTQSVQVALKMYREIAEMDTDTAGQFTKLYCNVGVAGAQHFIGLLYQEGIGVEQNYADAAKWYKRAMENGVMQAANNLAILHSNGQGIPQDMKMAAMCWKEATNLKDHNAWASLSTYYMNEMEPDMALNMVRIGRKMGNIELIKLPDTQLHEMISRTKADREALQPRLLEFEKENGLSVKGLIFKERTRRQIRSISPVMEKIAKLNERSFQNYACKTEGWGGKQQSSMNLTMLAAIHAKSCQGSETATRILDTMEYVFKLRAVLDVGRYKTREQKMEIIDLLYNCVTREQHLLSLSVESRSRLKLVVRDLFEECCEVKGDDDMRIRYCYVDIVLSVSMKTDDMYPVEVLAEGIRRYPYNLNYYDSIAIIMGIKQKYKEGKRFAEEGLKKFPNNPELLYHLACHLRLGESSLEVRAESKAAFKQFLRFAAADHRKVPEAYYQLSSLYLRDIAEVSPEKRSNCKPVEFMKTYYKRGQEAERNQLPCYLPYGESDVKAMIQNLLELDNPAMDGSHSVNTDIQDVLERKTYLHSPTRRGVILLHRRHLKRDIENEHLCTKLGIKLDSYSADPKLSQTTVKKMAPLRPITLQEMDPTEDQIYSNRILDLTIIDDLVAVYCSIRLIAEDDNGDVTRLYIYNVEKNKETLGNFRAGCRVAIINPYMRIGANDTTHGIRTDDPRCIVYLTKVENMCRFCGEEDASRKCSLCKRPYCSRECQKLDWIEFSHKLICSVEF